jgi:PAS domain-containing protein
MAGIVTPITGSAPAERAEAMETRPVLPHTQEADLEAVAPLLVEGLALVDPRRRFVWVNDAGSRILGAPAADLCGRPSPFPTEAETGVATVPTGSGRVEVDYRATALADGRCAVSFRDVTDASRQQRRLAAVARAAPAPAGAAAAAASPARAAPPSPRNAGA